MRVGWAVMVVILGVGGIVVFADKNPKQNPEEQAVELQVIQRGLPQVLNSNTLPPPQKTSTPRGVASEAATKEINTKPTHEKSNKKDSSEDYSKLDPNLYEPDFAPEGVIDQLEGIQKQLER